jgi:NAD(P)-dependent dehydrogenase (short-subunit alcohol dehydrogenase family)
MKTILITGGGRGIGAGIAKMFGVRGWRVVLTYVADPDAAAGVVRHIEEAGGTVRAEACDLASEDTILSLFRTLDDDGVVLDALVNNAGVTGPKRRVDEVTVETLRHVTDVNFIGCVLMAREAVKRMSTVHGAAGGSIVNISSTAVNAGSPGQWVDYAALKGGLDVFTRGLAREVGGEGIRVNGVAPGYVVTDDEAAQRARFEPMRHEVSLGRIGSVDEIAEAVFWLCSDESTYVTGATIPVAGGR